MEYELRKWCELITPLINGAECRYFLKENKLVGISQRDCTQCYDQVSKQRDEISDVHKTSGRSTDSINS